MVKTNFDFTDFGDFSKAAIKAALTGHLATCAECCSERVVVSRTGDAQGPVWGISCGTPGCMHNIAALDLATAVNKWNEELVAEGDEEDYATEVVVYFI